MAVNCIYDIAIHLTNEEYEMKFRKKVNVQSIVEMPEIHIVARCQGDEHQLMYSSCRNDDINALIQNQITINGKILIM